MRASGALFPALPSGSLQKSAVREVYSCPESFGAVDTWMGHTMAEEAEAPAYHTIHCANQTCQSNETTSGTPCTPLLQRVQVNFDHSCPPKHIIFGQIWSQAYIKLNSSVGPSLVIRFDHAVTVNFEGNGNPHTRRICESKSNTNEVAHHSKEKTHAVHLRYVQIKWRDKTQEIMPETKYTPRTMCTPEKAADKNV